jgi:hypothetical protein
MTRRCAAVARRRPLAVTAPPSTVPALGLSGVTWALLYLGAFWLLSYFRIETPAAFAPVILGLFCWSVIYLYWRLCCRWPIAGFLLGSFIMGLFGSRGDYWGYWWRGRRW